MCLKSSTLPTIYNNYDMQMVNCCARIQKFGLNHTSFVLSRPAKSNFIGGDRPSKRHPFSRQFQSKSAKSPAKKQESKEDKLKGKKPTQDTQRSGLRKDDIHTLPQRNLREVKVLLTAVPGEMHDKKENKSRAVSLSKSVAVVAKTTAGNQRTEGSPQKRSKKKKEIVDEVHPLYAGISKALCIDDLAFYVPLAERVKLRRTGKSQDEKEIPAVERKHTGRKQEQAAGIETNSEDGGSLEPEKSKHEESEELETDATESLCNGEQNLSGMKRTSSPKKKIIEIDPSCARRLHLRSGSRLISLQQLANSESESEEGKLSKLSGGERETASLTETNKREETVVVSKEREDSDSDEKTSLMLPDGPTNSPVKQSCRKSKRTRRSGKNFEKEQPRFEEVSPENSKAVEEVKEENTDLGPVEVLHEVNVVESSDCDLQPNSSFYRDMPELSLVSETSPGGAAIRLCVGSEVTMDDCPVLEDCRSYELLAKIPLNVCISKNQRKRPRTESAPLEDCSEAAQNTTQSDVQLTDGNKINHVDGRELELPGKVAKLGDYCQVLPGARSACTGISFTDTVRPTSSESSSSSNAFERELSTVVHSLPAGPVTGKRQSRKSSTPKRFQNAAPEQCQTTETAFAISQQDLLGISRPVHRVLQEHLPLVPKVTTSSQCNFRAPFLAMVSSSSIEAPVTVSNMYDSRASSAIGSSLSMVRMELESVQKVLQERGGVSDVFCGTMPQLGWPSFESSYPSQGSFATSIPSTFGINSTSAFPSHRVGGRGGFPLPLDIVEPQVHPLPMQVPFVTRSVPVTHTVNYTDCLNFSDTWRGERLLPGFCLPQNFRAPSYHHQLGLNATSLPVNHSSSNFYIQNPNLVPEFVNVTSNQQVRKLIPTSSDFGCSHLCD